MQDKECYEKTTACDDSDVEHLPTDEDTLTSANLEQQLKNSNVWIKNENCCLTKEDQALLENPSGRPNDFISRVAQTILKKKCPSYGGFQDTILGQVLKFKAEKKEFVQIRHNGEGHWLTISTVGVGNKGECTFTTACILP